jgi:hypothetical protein
MLIRLTGAQFPHFSEVAAGGADVWFSKPDGTVLEHEIERWDATGKMAEIWVRMDTVKGNNSTQYVQMFWGEGAPAVSGQSAVFDTANGFEAAWHLGTDLADATQHAWDGTDHGTTGNSAVAGNGRTFDGSSDYISAAPSKPMLKSAAAATLECWFQVTTAAELSLVSVAAWNNGNTTMASRAAIIINEGKTGNITLVGRTIDNQQNGEQISYEAGAGLLYTWHHIAGVVNYSADSLFLFLDGKQVHSAKVMFNPATTPSTNSEVTVLGAEEDFTQYFFKGMMDEARISRVRRSADWIKLSYENQKSGSTVVTIE